MQKRINAIVVILHQEAEEENTWAPVDIFLFSAAITVSLLAMLVLLSFLALESHGKFWEIVFGFFYHLVY